LNQARAALDSVHGRIESDWKMQDGQFTWNIVVPPNTHATVYAPTSDANRVLESGNDAREALEFVSEHDGYAQYRVGAGTYEFTSIIA
jgi:alpha-L-rhamnosidase